VIELTGGYCKPSPTPDYPDRFEVKGGSEKRSYFFLPRSKKEMEAWVERIQAREGSDLNQCVSRPPPPSAAMIGLDDEDDKPRPISFSSKGVELNTNPSPDAGDTSRRSSQVTDAARRSSQDAVRKPSLQPQPAEARKVSTSVAPQAETGDSTTDDKAAQLYAQMKARAEAKEAARKAAAAEAAAKAAAEAAEKGLPPPAASVPTSAASPVSAPPPPGAAQPQPGGEHKDAKKSVFGGLFGSKKK
jgi:colicin import membrane protein